MLVKATTVLKVKVFTAKMPSVVSKLIPNIAIVTSIILLPGMALWHYIAC